jgi:hypothetical protein
MYSTGNIKQAVVAAVAAVILTATAVGAAVGPAETGPVYAQVQANGTLNG